MNMKSGKLLPTAATEQTSLCARRKVRREDEHLLRKTVAIDEHKIVKRSDNSIQLSWKSRNGSKCCNFFTHAREQKIARLYDCHLHVHHFMFFISYSFYTEHAVITLF